MLLKVASMPNRRAQPVAGRTHGVSGLLPEPQDASPILPVDPLERGPWLALHVLGGELPPVKQGTADKLEALTLGGQHAGRFLLAGNHGSVVDMVQVCDTPRWKPSAKLRVTPCALGNRVVQVQTVQDCVSKLLTLALRPTWTTERL